MFLRTTFLILLTALAAVAETRVRITGMTEKSEEEILGLMGGRLAHVRSHAASTSRADDAAFLVRQIMLKDGYNQVRVDYKVVNSSEILLTVHEGGRLSLGQVTVNGVPAAEAKTLAKLYARPAKKDRPLGSGDPPFREEDVATGLSYIVQQLNSEGFWGAEATLASRVTDPGTGVVNLVIDVSPGGRYHIGEVRITSPDGRGVTAAREAAAPYAGRRASTANLNAMRLAVEETFVSQGYPDANISMGRTLESPRFIPEFSIDLGKRVRLRQVHIEGLERTQPQRVRQRMESLEGEWYDEAAMNKRLSGFLATGAFSSARVETNEVSDDAIDATLHLEEANARELTLAVGGDSYLGPIFRIAYADRNLWGDLLGFSTGFEFSARGVLGETRITDPWLFGTDVSGTARLYALTYTREGYSSWESGLEGKTTWKFGDHYTLEVLAGYGVVELSEDGLPTDALGETNYRQPRIRVSQTLDFRNSAVLPKSGWHFVNPLEIGAAIGDITTSYVKAGLTGGWYHQINADYEVGLGGELGLLFSSGDKGNLPIDLRLFNGGARTVRSYPERELGPSVDGYPVGGEGMWNANAELIRNFSGSLKAVAFFDAGTLSRTVGQLGSSEIELALGLGLRLDLPIGPVRLEYGYNLTRDKGEPAGTIQFAIGMAF
ncbi:MAG: BamA/TamA family outer membrane protein [Verrucomicrobiota bacterium]